MADPEDTDRLQTDHQNPFPSYSFHCQNPLLDLTLRSILSESPPSPYPKGHIVRIPS